MMFGIDRCYACMGEASLSQPPVCNTELFRISLEFNGNVLRRLIPFCRTGLTLCVYQVWNV